MNSLKHLFNQYTAFFAGVLAYLGIWGVLVIATVDAIIPVIPLDPVIAAYVYKDPGRFWLYCLMGAVGSAVGSLVPYWIGRAGGELFLLKRIDRKRLEDMRDRHEKGEFFFIMIPSMLPPPTPMKLIILAAGVFEMRVPLFLTALFVGRMLRFMILSFFVVRFGPDIVHMFGNLMKEHMTALLITLGAIAVAGFLWWRWKKKKPASGPASLE
ncbi:MAG: VTT domain-containing protein [Terriglobales bacterium]